MSQRGKKSAASLSVAPVGVEQRLAPASGLSDPQKAVWVGVVNARPADWFGDEHSATLAQYCRHVVQADIVSQQIEVFEPEWLSTEEGLRRYDKLLAIQERETRAINALARSMRITNQAIYDHKKVPGSKKSKRPWEEE